MGRLPYLLTRRIASLDTTRAVPYAPSHGNTHETAVSSRQRGLSRDQGTRRAARGLGGGVPRECGGGLQLADGELHPDVRVRGAGGCGHAGCGASNYGRAVHGEEAGTGRCEALQAAVAAAPPQAVDPTPPQAGRVMAKP